MRFTRCTTRRSRLEHVGSRVTVQRVRERRRQARHPARRELELCPTPRATRTRRARCATTMRAVNKLAVNTQASAGLPGGEHRRVRHTVADVAKRADGRAPGRRSARRIPRCPRRRTPSSRPPPCPPRISPLQMRGLKGKMDAEKAERFTEVLERSAPRLVVRQGGGGVRGGVRQGEEAAQDEALRRVPGVLQDGRKNFDPDTTKLMDQTKILGERWQRARKRRRLRPRRTRRGRRTWRTSP